MASSPAPLFPETVPYYHMCVLPSLRHALRTAGVERRLEGNLIFFILTIQSFSTSWISFPMCSLAYSHCFLLIAEHRKCGREPDYFTRLHFQLYLCNRYLSSRNHYPGYS